MQNAVDNDKMLGLPKSRQYVSFLYMFQLPYLQRMMMLNLDTAVQVERMIVE
jgi:hypothetical protein